MTQTISSSLSSSAMVFRGIIRMTVGSHPHLYPFSDRVRHFFFESSNDGGYLSIRSNTYTLAANRLYSSSAENYLPTNRLRQGYEVFLLISSDLFTCSNTPFLAGLKKRKKMD